MKKTFTDTKPVVKDNALGKMTKEMQTIYDEFHGNRERLVNEWNLCNNQYDATIKCGFEAESDFNARIHIRRIANYWKARKTALENTVTPELLKAFIDSRKTKTK